MTTLTHFWEDPAFAEFVPHIRATAAWDKRHGNSPRFDLKSNTPFRVLVNALAFKGHCVECGKEISVFRARHASNKRAKGMSENVYLAATCPLEVRVGCSRGHKASKAYQEIWDLIRSQPSEGTQGGLL